MQLNDNIQFSMFFSLKQILKFFSDQRKSSYLSKIFENEMCQAWSKQLENEGVLALCRRFPLLS
jgi:hypothetical protein